jgi:hypothetical protein
MINRTIIGALLSAVIFLGSSATTLFATPVLLMSEKLLYNISESSGLVTFTNVKARSRDEKLLRIFET